MAPLYTSIDALVDEIKGNLRLSQEDTYDDAIALMCRAVLSLFSAETGTSFGEILSFNAQKLIRGTTQTICVGYFPIVEVLYVGPKLEASLSTTTSEDEEESEYVLQENVDFVVNKEAGIINFDAPIYGLYEIVGTYGYEEIPNDIGLACIMQTTFMWQKRTNLGATAMSLPGGDITYQEKLVILDMNANILERYKR